MADSAQRCAFVILAFPTHCGEDCQRGNKHTQDWNVAHMVRSIHSFIITPQKVDYPIVIFHEDYNLTQRRRVEAQTKVPVLFEKVNFTPRALPDFYQSELERIAQDVRPSHRNGNLSSPSMRGTYHGFGYRMMCRFFAGLIMWHPAMTRFDWYMRVDAGDSRLTGPFSFDPFALMRQGGYKYAYHRIAPSVPNSRLDAALRNFTVSRMRANRKLLAPFIDEQGRYNGKYYYNNFEVVHLPTFRSDLHRHMFDVIDRSGAFMLGDTPKHNLGDADYRSVTVAFMLKPREVYQFKKLKYQHPAPWDAPYQVELVGT